MPPSDPILDDVDALVAPATRWGRVETLATVQGLPVRAFELGTAPPAAPALLITGGVHGVERIGAEVALAYLRVLLQRLAWDEVLRDTLARCRLRIVPVVNPVGIARGTRANGAGVDLMRNAPADAVPSRTTPLLSGQRISPRLPWYTGPRGAGMEPEATALVAYVEGLFDGPLAVALDLHSGFGFADRIWYPYARTREPPPDLGTFEALGRAIDGTLPHHAYTIEQTAQAYTILGDLWDHLYDRRRATGSAGLLVPLTLEMGSWTWVRKNPLQGLTTLGRFNPIKPHRVQRTLRRHLPLLDTLLHAAASYRAWLPQLG